MTHTHTEPAAQSRAPSRRTLLLGAAGATGLAVGAGALTAPAAAAAPAAPSAPAGRTYTGGRFMLSLDGKAAAIVDNVEGGEIEAAVTTLPMAHDYYTKKHLGNVKYNEFSVELGLSMGQPIKDWIEASLAGNSLRKSGELQAADFKYDEARSRQFTKAVITKVGFPACDGGSKEAGYLTVSFAPELTRHAKGGGSLQGTKQKAWLVSNYRLTIGGLEKASAKVSKVGALTIKQTTSSDPVGTRTGQVEPTKLEFPNLEITLPEADAGPFYAWHTDFVIDGNNGEAQERTGRIDYLDTDGRTVLLSLDLHGIGIFKAATDAAEVNGDGIRRVSFTCYVQHMVAKFAR